MTHLKDRAVFRIYTEDKNREKTINLASRYFLNFSVFYGKCVWHSNQESTVVFEVVDDSGIDDRSVHTRVINLAKAIRKLNKQTDVLVTESRADVTFVTQEDV